MDITSSPTPRWRSTLPPSYEFTIRLRVLSPDASLTFFTYPKKAHNPTKEDFTSSDILDISSCTIFCNIKVAWAVNVFRVIITTHKNNNNVAFFSFHYYFFGELASLKCTNNGIY